MIIQIDKLTAEKIKNIKMYKRESYDEIINRLLVNYNNKNNIKINDNNNDEK